MKKSRMSTRNRSHTHLLLLLSNVKILQGFSDLGRSIVIEDSDRRDLHLKAFGGSAYSGPCRVPEVLRTWLLRTPSCTEAGWLTGGEVCVLEFGSIVN